MKCIEMQPQHSSFVCQTNTAASKKDAPKKGPSAPQRVGPQKMQVRVACCKHFDWKDWQPHAFSPSAFKIFADSDNQRIWFEAGRLAPLCAADCGALGLHQLPMCGVRNGLHAAKTNADT